MTAHEIMLTVRGMRVAAKAWGEATARPCLALHGWLDNANSFDRLAPLLPNLRLVAVDLPGHGHTSHHAEDGDYPFISYIEDVHGIAAALGWERFVLMGHSMGAGVASVYAGTFPQHVEHLILLDGLGPWSSPPQDAPKQLAQHIEQLVRLRRKRQPVYPSVAAVAAQLVRIVPNMSLMSAQMLARRATRPVAADGSEGTGFMWRSDPRLRCTSGMRLTEEQVAAFLHRITCPTLMVRALDGYPFGEGFWERRARMIPHGQVVEVTGGHHVHMEDAAHIAAVIGAALRADT